MGIPQKTDGLEWKVPYQWMIFRGTPIFGNLHIVIVHRHQLVERLKIYGLESRDRLWRVDGVVLFVVNMVD